ncbi:MAG: hypothetical protein GY849_23610, partial [Deltaproteobacteria bacterium]|nr:hypothetical protein [Deltaproteobacteria bacterium]
MEYLYLAKRKGWDCVEFVTGDRLFDRHEPIWEEAISQNLIGRLFISTEAATPELFEDIRGHKFENFDRLLSGVTRFKQKYQSPLEINFGVTCMKANLKDLPNIIPLAAGFGVSTIYMRHLDTVQFAISRKSNKLCIPEQHLNSIDRKEVLAVFEKVIHLGKKYKIEVALPERFPEITSKIGHLVAKAEKKIRIRCYEPFKWVQVWFSGDIFPCCYTDHAYSLGSINNLDFYSIWNNLKYKRLIDGLRPGGDPIDACKRCNVLGLPDRI